MFILNEMLLLGQFEDLAQEQSSVKLTIYDLFFSATLIVTFAVCASSYSEKV